MDQKQIVFPDSEICFVRGGSAEDKFGVCYITMRLNRDSGNLRSFNFRIPLTDLTRLIEDANHILRNSESLNTPETLATCVEHFDVVSLLQRYDQPYPRNS